MNVREWVNRNSAAVTIFAVVVLIVSLGVIILGMGGGRDVPRVVDVYYFDLGTGELFTGRSDQVPPLDAPSGANKGVRAYVFSCGECSDAASRYIGWLEMYTPAARKAMSTPVSELEQNPELAETLTDTLEQGHLVSLPDGKQWVVAMSEPGMRIMEAGQSRCGEGTAPKPCVPAGE